MKNTINLSGEIDDSLSNGPGLRYVLFTQGCNHKCIGCHNPHTWDYKINTVKDINLIFNEIKSKPMITGVTFSGGEPFDQAEPLLYLVKRIKEETKLDVLIYTGYTYETLNSLGLLKLQEEDTQYKYRLLNLIDILIDGPFKEQLKEGAMRYAGSTNQRMLYLKGGKILDK